MNYIIFDRESNIIRGAAAYNLSDGRMYCRPIRSTFTDDHVKVELCAVSFTFSKDKIPHGREYDKLMEKFADSTFSFNVDNKMLGKIIEGMVKIY